jgi:hypothetical protein
MTCHQRHVCGQALVMAGGWFSLRYGWGIEVQCWPVVLAFGAVGPGFAVVEVLPSDPADAAPLFFSALRRLDASGVARIYARGIPESGLGMAIMDRLRRAAHG